MKKFLERYHSKITGVVSTFDRMIFKGHSLPFLDGNFRVNFSECLDAWEFQIPPLSPPVNGGRQGGGQIQAAEGLI